MHKEIKEDGGSLLGLTSGVGGGGRSGEPNGGWPWRADSIFVAARPGTGWLFTGSAPSGALALGWHEKSMCRTTGSVGAAEDDATPI